MKHPFNVRPPTFDSHAIQQTIQKALASAGLDTQTGPMQNVTETIRRALAATQPQQAAAPFDDPTVVDVMARVVPTGEDTAAAARPASPGGEPELCAGSFQLHEYSLGTSKRAYKVYVPPGSPQTPQTPPALRAMLVMLHGCTQSADDFAAGTQMNRLADRHGFLVVYPEQASHANASKCWNWFKPEDQMRGAGEPALIAGIVRAVAQQHGADPRRIFVAGLSAGAAMAVVLGETYPDLFAGVGAHSGLPYGSANDVPSALAAMKGGRSGGITGLKSGVGKAGAPRKRAAQAVPTIVFHGDRDHTVQASNGVQLVRQAQEAFDAGAASQALQTRTQAGVAPGGRRYSRTVYADSQGRGRVESWTLHGAGHAWSGGHASGSFTDATGPDASAEMLRFFLQQSQGGAA